MVVVLSCYYGCQDIGLSRKQADQWTVAPRLIEVDGQHLIFFAVTSLEEYVRKLKRQAQQQLQENNVKKQAVVKFEKVAKQTH